MSNDLLSIRIRIKVCFLLLCCMPAGAAQAQDAGMPDLRAALAHMKALRTYSYETVTDAVFPNGKKDKMVTTVYMDGPNQRLCYKTNFEILMLTGKWAYKADHTNKTISVFDVVKYNDKYKKALPELGAVFKSSMAATFMDSVILKEGKLKSARKKGDLTTFVIGFSEYAAIEEMTIVYNQAKQLPESVHIRAYYAAGPGAPRSKGMQMETLSRGYTTTVPESVFDPLQYFRVQGGKVILAQFKNYKVSSIL